MTPARVPGVIHAGGAAFVVAGLAFTGVFTYLAVQFNYPEVLDAPAAEALPALVAMGAAGRAVWALYGVLPLLLIPAAVGAHAAFAPSSRGGMRLATLLATVAALAMTLGLLRWPSIQWELALAFGHATDEGRIVISAVFDGLNSFMGNFVGEFVGELCLNAFFVLNGRAMLKTDAVPPWMGWLGIASGVLGWIAMWRNITEVVGVAAELNNIMLPLWMIAFGIQLIRFTRLSEDSREGTMQSGRGPGNHPSHAR